MAPKGRTTKPRVGRMISKRSDEAEVPERVAEARGAGRKPRTKRGGAELGAATSGRTKSEDHKLMEEVVERSNLKLAYQRVVENKGAPGVDDVSVPEFKDWLKMRWPSVKIALVGRPLSSAPGTPSGHPKAFGRDENARCADGGRPADPTSATSGAATAL